ncbi:MAG: glutamate--tRNA ligase, partial [bacterium]|nr:glutamate--tRNA ligase [bacterium]
MTRTRFAPSPTGELHLGGLRTALYAWLYARHYGGAFSLRIEDTDRARFVAGSAERIFSTLRKLGLTWDEGPDIGGPHAPYVQSERLERYQAAAQTLIERGSAYRCDCSAERLQQLRDAQTAAQQPTRYDGHCRAKADINPQQPHVIRFRMPEEGSVTVADVIHGDVTVSLATLDDFVLLKSDGYPTYHLAHVVDDHEMLTSHVIRGDEWLPSLPKHVLLFRAFGWEPPAYAHLPLLLNAQHKKLSKRDGDTDVASFLRWCLPDALINFIALLGWNPSGERDVYTHDELVASFDLTKVNRSPAVVDFTKLEWMNGEYIRQLAPVELLAAVRGTGVVLNAPEDMLIRILTLEQPRLKRLDAIPAWYFHPVNLGEVPLAWKQTDTQTTRHNLQEISAKLESLDLWPDTPQELEAIVKPWLTERNLGVGETLWPMRVALSG